MFSVIAIIIFFIYVIINNKEMERYRDEIKEYKKEIEVLKEKLYGNKKENFNQYTDIDKTEFTDNYSQVVLEEEKFEQKTERILEENENKYNYTNESFLEEKENSFSYIKKENNNEEIKNEEDNKIENYEENNEKIDYEKLDRERKNSLILVTGAILIVLSAIVFLMSTWDFISDIFKTGILFLLIGVFLGISKVAEEKFKLSKTSNTFFYIAMAYVPVCLLSISIFGLFGDYFSINGEGKSIYLTFVFGVTALVYYFNYILKNNKNLLYGSILSQLFSIVLFSLIFSTDILFICVNLLLYNLLFIILTKESKILNNEIFYKVLPYFACLITLGYFFETNKYEVFSIVLIIINLIVLEYKYRNIINSYLLNFILSLFGFYIIFEYKFDFSENLKVLYSILYIILIYIVENILLIKSDRKDLKKSSTVFTLFSLLIINVYNIIHDDTIIKNYFILFIQLLVLLFTYIKTNYIEKNILSILISIVFIIMGHNIIYDIDLPYYYYVIFSIVTFFISSLINKEKYKELAEFSFIISHIYILGIYFYSIIISENYTFSIIYIITLMIVYIYSYLKNKEYVFFRYATYFISNILIYAIFRKLKITEDFYYIIPIITTVFISILEYKLKESDILYSSMYIIVSEVVSYIWISFIGTEISAIISLVFSLYILIYNQQTNSDDSMFNLIPFLGIIPSVLFYDYNEIFRLILFIICFIPTSVISILKNKINIYTVFSVIYLIIYSINSNLNMYFAELLFFIWSLAHLYYYEKYEKDIFLFLTYLSTLFIYYSLINDLSLTNYAIFNFIGIIVFLILLLRKILIKYIDTIDIYEAIAFIILYIIAISSYTDEIDGILFVLLIVGIVIFSYLKRYGSMFLVSLGAIIVNIFLLTREFWFSIPWWVYLLGIGSILITFAIRNEAREEKKNLGTIIKEIKKKVDGN